MWTPRPQTEFGQLRYKCPQEGCPVYLFEDTRNENIISEWKPPKSGIPQGTKLGVILFTIMTNNLLRSWNLRIKFVDDTTALEIIPRNSASVLNFVANDIYAFSEDHRMKSNPTK